MNGTLNAKKLVRDLMTTDVAAIRDDGELHELEKLLLQRRVHGVPVVDKEGRIVGVVSQTDLLAWHFETGVDGVAFHDGNGDWLPDPGDGRRLAISDIRTALVKEIMSPLVHVIGQDKTIAEAATRMIRERIHRLVVVDARFHVLGILSALDLMCVVPGVETVTSEGVVE